MVWMAVATGVDSLMDRDTVSFNSQVIVIFLDGVQAPHVYAQTLEDNPLSFTEILAG